ncbi:MAG: hypothetical protein ACRCRP_00260 [Metamycoplasmataceae bacterium]
MKNKAIFTFLISVPALVIPTVVSSCSVQGDSLDNIYNDINKKGIEIVLNQKLISNNNININEVYQSYQNDPNTVFDFANIYNQIPNLQNEINNKNIIPSFVLSLPTPEEQNITIIVKFEFSYNPNRPNNTISKTYKLSELKQIKDNNTTISSWTKNDLTLKGYQESLESIINQFKPIIETYFKTIKYNINSNGVISGMDASSLNSKVFDGQQPNIFSYLENPGGVQNPNNHYPVIFSTVKSDSEFASSTSFKLVLQFGL